MNINSHPVNFPTHFIKHVVDKLWQSSQTDVSYNDDALPINRKVNINSQKHTNVVLFLIANNLNQTDPDKYYLILTKRSLSVKQPGDLCCPGGSLSPKLDSLLSKMNAFPGFPLYKWPYLKQMKEQSARHFSKLNLLLAAGLREGFEEIRLNPLSIQFLGSLPPQDLIMFYRRIYPMVCLNRRQKRFILNNEVEKIVYVPLDDLLNSDNYRCYRLDMNEIKVKQMESRPRDYLCYIHNDGPSHEILWGATLRITMKFLEIIFDFIPPELDSLPVVEGVLSRQYLSGQSSS